MYNPEVDSSTVDLFLKPNMTLWQAIFRLSAAVTFPARRHPEDMLELEGFAQRLDEWERRTTH